MEEIRKKTAEITSIQVDEEKKKHLKKTNRDTTMRTANIRVSATNKVTVDNKKLGVKAGDIVTYTKEDIIKTLKRWNEKKQFSYYAIEHDADPDNKHFHIVLEFYKNSVCKFSLLKRKFPYGNIETCKSVRACVQYLIHLNHPEKHQYSWDDVITNNTARLELYKIQGDYSTDAKLNYIMYQINNGNIKRFEIGKKIDYDIYLKYENKIKTAFRYVDETKIVDNDRDFQVFVLQGPSRVGKTTFCKAVAKMYNYSIGFSSSGKHPFDEYRGQDIFVIDDNGNSVFSIDDMKKLLDPYTNTGVSARYHNVNFKDCKLIFICTNTPICEWFEEENNEDRNAFYKRISYVFDFEGISDDYVATYTKNEILYINNKDWIETQSYPGKKFILVPIEEEKCYFDLKKYIDPESDIEKKKKFLEDIKKI